VDVGIGVEAVDLAEAGGDPLGANPKRLAQAVADLDLAEVAASVLALQHALEHAPALLEQIVLGANRARARRAGEAQGRADSQHAKTSDAIVHDELHGGVARHSRQRSVDMKDIA
jgi:hypothetical protein